MTLKFCLEINIYKLSSTTFNAIEIQNACYVTLYSVKWDLGKKIGKEKVYLWDVLQQPWFWHQKDKNALETKKNFIYFFVSFVLS